MKRETPRISCHKCIHFYVTWDNRFPYGCKVIGFKGKLFPSMVVLQASGHHCLFFQPKQPKKEESS